MKYEEIIRLGSKLPVIETKMLAARQRDKGYMDVQFSRWVKAGKLIQLKRGMYLLPPAYRKIQAFEPFIANLIKRPSYLSLEKALEYFGLIPEAVSVYTSVTTKRQSKFRSAAGVFSYRHIKNSLFWGYAPVTVNRQTALVALPEKAILDLFYLKKDKIAGGYIEEMRFQNTDRINIKRLKEFARRFGKKKITAAARDLAEYIRAQRREDKKL